VIYTAKQRLRVLIETVLKRHHNVAEATEELIETLADEIEERARDRVTDLCAQLEGGQR
jgi:hypothetical protein